MIVYHILRLIAGVALRWFYRDVTVRNADRIPPNGTPVLLVVNHPNALVDALLVGWAVKRQLTVTAKATLFENPRLGAFLRYMGVVPLRRFSDERQRIATEGESADTTRNTEAFRAILERLEKGGAVLIFPEGRSHDEPALAPLRTGPARIALQAYQEGRVRSIAILPIGLVFERKEAPRSRVLVEIGEPLDLDQWIANASSSPSQPMASKLTSEIDRRLRDVTLNYTTTYEAVQTRGLAKVFASLLDDPPAIGARQSLQDEVELERRIAQARRLLEHDHSETPLRSRAEEFLNRVDAFEHTLHKERIRADDVGISLQPHHGAWFVLREGGLLAVAGPIAAWGRLNHWIPFRLARALGERDMNSRDQPAMRTILAGLVLVLLWYAGATFMVAQVVGKVAATVYLVSLPISADIDLRLSERMQRARQRMRAYLHFQRKPDLQKGLSNEHQWLTQELVTLAKALDTSAEDPATQHR